MNNFTKTYKIKINDLARQYKNTQKKPLSWLHSKELFNFVNETQNNIWKTETQCEQNWNNSNNQNQISNKLFENIFKKINCLFLEKIQKNLKKENIKETKIKFNEVLEISNSKAKTFLERLKKIKIDDYMDEIGQIIGKILSTDITREWNTINKQQPIINIIASDELCNIVEKTYKDLKPFYKNPILNYFHSVKIWSSLYNVKATENNFLNKSQTLTFEELSDSGSKITEYKLNFENIVVLIVISNSQLKINNHMEVVLFKNTEHKTNNTKQNQYKTRAEIKIDENFYEDNWTYKCFAIKS